MRARIQMAVGLLVVSVLASACQSDGRGGDWLFGSDRDGGPDAGGVELDRPDGCGNGRVDGVEVCDGDELAGQTCGDFGYDGGRVRCNDTCTGYLVDKCEGIPDWPAFTPDGWTRPDPCAACDDNEVCVRGACLPRTCGDSPARIEQTWTIDTAEIDGRLSFPSGADVPESGRATVYFVHRQTEDFSKVEWDLGESRGFQTRLYEGSYRVWVRIRGEGWPTFAVAHGPVDVDGDRRLEVDVPRIVTARGTLQVAGYEAPKPGRFRIVQPREQPPGVRGGRLSFDVDETLRRAYEARMYVGQEYVVRFVPNYEAFEDDPFVYVEPEAILEERLRPDGDLERDFAVTLNAVSFGVTVDGAPPEGVRHLEFDLFRSAANGDGWREKPFASVQLSGSAPDASALADGRLRVPLLEGRYRAVARLTPFEGSYQQTIDRVLTVPKRDRVAIDFPGESTWVHLTGTVSGLPDGDDGETKRDSLLAYDEETGSFVRDGLPAEEPAPFDLRVPEGTVDLQAGWTHIADGQRFGSQTVREDLSVRDAEEPYRLDLEVRPPEPVDSVDLRGRLTINGRPLTAVVQTDPDDRSVSSRYGAVSFECLEGTCERFEPQLRFEEGRYEARLVPGRYRVVYRSPTRHADYCHPPRRGAVAGRRYVLDPDLRIAASHRRDFDIKAVRLQGRVTVDGDVPERVSSDYSETAEIGDVHVARSRGFLDANRGGGLGCYPWGDTQPNGLAAADGAATFETLAFPGHYRLYTDLASRGSRERGLALRDGTVEFDEDFETTQIEGRIEHTGDAPGLPDVRYRKVRAATRTGRATFEVDDQGRFSGEVIGRDPTLVYQRRFDRRAMTSDPDREVVLREGCIDPTSIRP